MKKNLLDLNLQLFAEDELGENDQNIADSDNEFESDESSDDESNEVEDVETETDGKEEEEETPDFKNEQNAAFANMRRELEKAKRESREKDEAIARFCKGHTHPVTGKPITTVAEYEDALYQQDRLRREEELKEKGIDPTIIERAIEQSPLLREAQTVIEQNRQKEAERVLQSDFEEIKKLDPSIKTFSDIPNIDSIQNMVNGGLSLLNAFKVVNFDTLVAQRAAGAKQSAINQMKGKSHMSGVDSLANDSSEVEIPEAELRSLKEVFPDKSMADLKKLYNKTISKLGGK